jgi:predicted RNA-binding protein YlxR (DUF448 family)
LSGSASDPGESLRVRRAGASARRTVPVRSCVACRTARDKRELVRVVRTPDGRIQIDESGRVAGRGAYLCRDAGCWTRAVERGALGRALEAPVPPELREVLLAGPQALNTTGGAARGQE